MLEEPKRQSDPLLATYKFISPFQDGQVDSK